MGRGCTELGCFVLRPRYSLKARAAHEGGAKVCNYIMSCGRLCNFRDLKCSITRLAA